MDVSLWIRFTTPVRRERAPLTGCRSSTRSTIHARHFASSIGRLSRALQMESYPKFHNEVGVPFVRIGCREFKCIGDKPPQNHPHIYLKIGRRTLMERCHVNPQPNLRSSAFLLAMDPRERQVHATLFTFAEDKSEFSA